MKKISKIVLIVITIIVALILFFTRMAEGFFNLILDSL
jgi:predicted RND superfamily exporter protein